MVKTTKLQGAADIEIWSQRKDVDNFWNEIHKLWLDVYDEELRFNQAVEKFLNWCYKSLLETSNPRSWIEVTRAAEETFDLFVAVYDGEALQWMSHPEVVSLYKGVAGDTSNRIRRSRPPRQRGIRYEALRRLELFMELPGLALNLPFESK